MNPNPKHAGPRLRDERENDRALTSSDPHLEALINRALSAPPEIHIPDNFAAVTARRALAQAPVPRSVWMGWGPRLALGSGALLTAAMFALAPHAAPSLSNMRFDTELLLLAELCALLLFSHQLFLRD